MSASVLFWSAYLGAVAIGALLALAVVFYVAYRIWRFGWKEES